MTWAQIKLGAEPKKVVILAVLLLAAGYFFISNSTSSDSGASAKTAPGTSQPVLIPGNKARPAGHSNRATKAALNKNNKEFRPGIGKTDVDPNTDPTLHINLLAKLQDVKIEGVGRSLFEVGDAPAAIVAAVEPKKIDVKKLFTGPVQPPPPAPEVKPPTPRAPQIPLKFYGFVNPARMDNKRAFFLDGDEIIIAAEGEVVKKRYKILRIGVNSAVVEDTTFKGDNTQQTLPLEAEMNG